MLGKKQLQKIFKLPLLLPREKAISVVRNSPLFDKDWYLSTYPDIKNAGVDSAGHFFSIGWLEGRDPSYLFNTKEYLRKHHISFCPLLLEKEPYLPREVFFSIVVASYNYREELQICLDSLISQNYSNFEIIVVDDGSCDGSIELIESYCDKFPFIRFYHHPGRENKGLPETVNLGVSQARGKYIAFCESDDYWTDDHLFELNKFIQKASLNTQDCGILGGGTDIIVNDVELVGDAHRCSEMREAVENRKLALLECNGFIAPAHFRTVNYIVTFSACCVRRDLFKKCDILNVPKKTALDWWIWRQLAFSSKVSFIDKKLTYWRLHLSYNIRHASEEEKKNELFKLKLDKIIQVQNSSLQIGQNVFSQKMPPSKLYSSRSRVLSALSEIQRSCFSTSRILYISNSRHVKNLLSDGSSRYRAFHMAEALKKMNAVVSVTSAKEFVERPSDFFDIYIFHRPGFSQRNLIEKLKEKKKILIADFDDLIFGDENIALASSLFINGNASASEAIDSFNKNLAVLSLFDNISVSTYTLGEKVKEFFPEKHVGIIHNFIPDSVLAAVRSQRLLSEPKDNDLILYASGTASHKYDFQMVEEELIYSLDRNKHLKLLVIGVLPASPRIMNHPSVFFRSPVPFLQLFKLMSRASFSIAPLERTVFNSCKSNVKFLESCLAGNILIASPIGDFQRVSDANIYLAETKDDWREFFTEEIHKIKVEEKLVENFDYLQKNNSALNFYLEFSEFFKGIKYE